MRLLSTKEAVDNALRVLLYAGEEYRTRNWQANLISENHMVELTNVFLQMQMIQRFSTITLQQATGADLPWAEDHFNERLAGRSNPGEQYKNWPYLPDFEAYLNEEGQFSHTYQERFWPEKGGNWKDVVDRLSSDTTTRQAFLGIWHPEDQYNKGVRVPCTIGYWFKINKGLLDITYLIRSCDARRHFRNDVYMTQRLASEMIRELSLKGIDLCMGAMTVWIGSFHCFRPDTYEIKKQLNKLEHE